MRSSRREFLTTVTAAWTIVIVTAATSGAALVRYLYPNDTSERSTQFKIGSPREYPVAESETVDERYKINNRIWVVRDDRQIYVLSAVCTHGGCPMNWRAKSRRFECACDGSQFDVRGRNVEGPADRSLERVKVTLAPDGRMEVDTSRKFREELGQWSDREASVAVTREP